MLTTSDIQNHAEYEAKSASVNLGSSMSFDGKLKPGGTGVGLGKDGDSAESTTRSGITGVAGNTDVRTGDPESGIKPIFDQEKVQKEIEAQTRITQLFSQYAIKEVSVHTEAAYKAMFKNEAKFYQVSCSATPMECLNDPKLIVMQEITIDDAKQNGKVLAVNGILNGDSRAAQLAYQNVPEDQSTGQKPDSLTLMHIAPADTGFGELLVAGYEKFLASTFGYTIADTTYADALQGRGDLETLSLGHSRGTIVQKNALDIVASMGYVNQGLSVFGVGGAVGYEEYAASARKVIKLDDTKQLEQQIIYTYFANDPVSVIAAGNPGDAISAFKDLSNVIKTSNSAHSCYGTGAKDCSTIANPVPGGPTPTNQNSDLIRVYRNGKLAQSGQH